MLAVAKQYLQAGLCVLPAIAAQKRPALPAWKRYQGELPSAAQVEAWFITYKACCLITGRVSGNLELLDFDFGGELFSDWCSRVNNASPGLLDRLVVERSQSGGLHVVYRCASAVEGNRKLAQRTITTVTPEPVELGGKQCVPRKVGDHYEATMTLIETRGEGGLFLCAPTPGYVVEQGSIAELPVLTAAERAVLIDAATSLDQPKAPDPEPVAEPQSSRPGDDYNQRGDVRAVLQRHGWALVQHGENEHWRRPGKIDGTSATLKDGVFYVFSSNAAPFEPDKAYPPFSVYALLEHGGDFALAASSLRGEGYGSDDTSGVDLSAFAFTPIKSPEPITHDPGPIPVELLRVPGFVSEVMDHSLETAPYPNQALAFCGALALQAFLAGRKVRDGADNRTNLYLLGLAHSASGKDWPRKVNVKILHEIDLTQCLGERFASGEGLQDALYATPSMLFQTDEIDGLLQSINKSRDAKHEGILSTLLTMYSSANSVYPMRRQASSKEAAGTIDQPCLVVYGTAIPNHYYEALSSRMLTNGFFARMLIIESGARSPGQEPSIIAPPERVLNAAKWWSDYCPGERRGNLLEIHPVPATVEHSDDARRLLAESRLMAEAEYAKAEQSSDPVATTVWGRVSEQIRKLALIYAVSANHESPQITGDAVRWAWAVVEHQTKRMLYMAAGHVADNPFHGECLKLLRKLREAPERKLPHSVLLKRMKMDTKTFNQTIGTLIESGEVMADIEATSGRPSRFYVAV